MLKAGIRGRMEITVTEEKTARAMGSGELDVFATPAMAALMEETAWRSVAGELLPGETTVGTKLDLRHTAATPAGLNVTCETELTEADGRRLVFHITVSDPCGPVGEGTHERYIVQAEKFLRRASEKAGEKPE